MTQDPGQATAPSPDEQDSDVTDLFDALESFVDASRRGECPSKEDLFARFPTRREQIRNYLELSSLVDELREPIDEILAISTDGRRTVRSASTLPKRLGEYRLLRELGRGGMGVVYEAQHESLERRVAIKVLPAHAYLDARNLERFRREARAAAALDHPGIVPVYDVGEDSGVHFYVMQFVDGKPVTDVIAQVRKLRSSQDPVKQAEPEPSPASALLSRRLPTSAVAAEGATREAEMRDRAASDSVTVEPSSGGGRHVYARNVACVALQIAEALGHAHAQGILHRDIKPSNLLLDATGAAYIADFGLAKAEGSDDLTHSGDVIGTIAYMPPERFHGWSDKRSDVYGLGVTLYEMLVLRRAFSDTDRARLIRRVTTEAPTAPRKLEASVPRDLETIVLKAIAKEPSARYQSAGELAGDLRRFLRGQPVSARRSGRLERFAKWVRREPTLASLLAALIVAAIGMIAGSLWYNAVITEQSEALRREQYFVDMRQAAIDLEREQRREITARLVRHVPSDGETDPRGFEWYFLRNRTGRGVTILEKEGGIRCMDVAPDQRSVVLGLADGSVEIVDLRSRMATSRFATGHESLVRVRYSPDGSLVATSGMDRRVRVWEVSQQTLRAELNDLASLPSHLELVHCSLAFSPGGKRLAVAFGRWDAKDGGVHVWDAKTWRAAHPRISRPYISSLEYSADGALLCGTIGGAIYRTTIDEDGAPREVLLNTPDYGDVRAICSSSDGRWIVTAQSSNRVEVRASDGAELVWAFDADTYAASFALSRDESELVVATYGNRTNNRELLVFRVQNGELLARAHDGIPKGRSVAVSPDGAEIAVGGLYGRVVTLERTSLSVRQTLRTHSRGVLDLAYSANGRWLASASATDELTVWDLKSGDVTFRRSLPSDAWSVRFSADSRRLVTSTLTSGIYFFDTHSWQEVAEFRLHDGGVPALDFSGNGELMVSGGQDGDVRLWWADVPTSG